jgi:hypothetical protein
MEKLDCPVSYSVTSGFGSFRIKTRKVLNLKIEDILRHEK